MINPQKENTALHQEDKTIAVNGVNIRYRDTGGPGMPVLLSHGIGGSLELWTPQLNAGCDRLRVIAWDMPGHGLSDLGDQPYDIDKLAQCASGLVKALGIERVIAGGNSLGGAVSVRMAALIPDCVIGLVLADAATLGRQVFAPFRVMVLPLFGELMSKPSDSGVERQIQAIFLHRDVATQAIRQVIVRNTFKAGGAKAFLATLRSLTRFRGQVPQEIERSLQILRRIEVPVMYVHGRDDVVIPAQHSIDAQAATPGSQLVILEDCGHTPQLEKPAEFNQALAEFAASFVRGENLTRSI